MIENEMRPAIVNWLNRNGYYDGHELLIGGYCDVIGGKFDERVGRRKPDMGEMICVELKMRDIAGVIYQAKGNHHHCNLSYAAMPMDFCLRMMWQSHKKFSDAGVGLLGIINGKVLPIHNSRYNNKTPDVHFRDKLWAFKQRTERHNAEKNL